MSASNWTWCPKCQADKIGDGVDEPDALLREDYEQGIYRGVYEVIYSGSCRVCGFKFKYQHQEQVIE